MKQFYPTYLYIKTHTTTGLKYFGKTKNDPYTYYGSGKHWQAHLKKHGYIITTQILGYYTDQAECEKVANDFSIKHNIVESKEWANMIIENGLDGGYTGRTHYAPHTLESRKKMSESRKGTLPWNIGLTGVTPGNKNSRSEETKQKLREANLGKKHAEETIEKRRQSLIGHLVTDETRKKISDARKGKPLSESHIQKLRDRIVSEETKLKIKEKRKNQIITAETCEKLKGKVVVVNKNGICSKISKEEFYSESNQKSKQYVFHNSKEGKCRK